MRVVEMPHVFVTCFAWSNFDHIAKGAVVGRGCNSKCHSGSQEYLGGMMPLYIPFSPPCRPKERGSQFSALLAARGGADAAPAAAPPAAAVRATAAAATAAAAAAAPRPLSAESLEKPTKDVSLDPASV